MANIGVARELIQVILGDLANIGDLTIRVNLMIFT